jgi:hypothetical protein
VLKEMHAAGQLRDGLQPQAVCSALIGMCEGMMRDQLVAQRLGNEAGYGSRDVRRVIDAVLPIFLTEPQVCAASH